MCYSKNILLCRNYLLVLLTASLSFFLNSCHYKKQNRLAHASSPYLQEHADNPVDWYEWGDEALQLAKRENKPLLISIGYAACHWCHEMEKESFMDTAVARIMNENFVCIKVDREERPDIDNIYINASQLISGKSGWPLNAFALPDGKPFFAGTYYSKQSWVSLLQQIATAYHNQPGKVNLQAQSLANGIGKLELDVLSYNSNAIDTSSYKEWFENVYKDVDLKYGGLKGAPKFPLPNITEFLLQYYYATHDGRALNAATTTLTKMALGGIYDQLGGGFSRYNIDSTWHIPHFEKILCDNAQLLSVYSHAYQLTGNLFFKNVVQETAAFIQRDLRSEEGCYFASVNADTKEGEGKFYAWTSSSLEQHLGQLAVLFNKYYNVSAKGNWKEGDNILYAVETPESYAQQQALSIETIIKNLTESKRLLLAERNKKEKPSIDHKILTSWNALIMIGFLDAYAAVGTDQYLQNAKAIAKFTENNLIQTDGSLLRSIKHENTIIPGFLDDYVLMAKAYIRLYQLTFEKHWLDLSKQLTETAYKNFEDPKTGMFYYTALGTNNIVIRKIEITDNNTPASNAIMADVLRLLGMYYNETTFADRSKKMLAKMQDQLNEKGPKDYPTWCCVAGASLFGTTEVAIIGKKAIFKNLELQKEYLPFTINLGSEGDENLSLLEGKSVASKTLFYVCVDKLCKRPVEEVKEALVEIQKP